MKKIILFIVIIITVSFKPKPKKIIFEGDTLKYCKTIITYHKKEKVTDGFGNVWITEPYYTTSTMYYYFKEDCQCWIQKKK